MPLQTGQMLQNRYRIDSLLGQGGMGAVYRAWDTRLNMSVAIKENLDASPAAQSQFGHEAHILANLSHPNLTRVTDYFFIAQQGQYLVMDYVEGEDLESMVNRRGFIPVDEAINWISQICDAINFLHRQNPPIIHRDIKPANIKIRPNGAAILVDFGIAKVFDTHLATTIGAKAITPGYSPPEQYGGSITDPRSDIYALGATLYRLMTGQVLPESVTRAVGSTNILLPRQLNPQIPPAIEMAILRAVEVATERRFQTVQDFRTALTSPPSTPVFQPISQVQPTQRADAPVFPQVGAMPNAAYQQPVSTPSNYQNPPAFPAASYQTYQVPPPSVPPPTYSPAPGSQPAGYPQGSGQPPAYYPPPGYAYPASTPPARPKWMLWVGIGSVALVLIAVAIILFSNGFLGGKKETKTPTPRATKKVTITATALPLAQASATFTATTGATAAAAATLTPVPSETTTPTATPPTILGTWSLFYTWGCEGNGGVEVATFLENNKFTTGGQWYGTFTYDGTNIAFTFSNGTRYSGKVSNNSTYMNGTMVDTNGYTGCWDAKPYKK